MSSKQEELEAVLHQPKRLAIVTELCANAKGCTFLDLKARCALTDGNLSRHLKSLEEVKVVSIRKSFVDQKPQTLVVITKSGREALFRYLENLEKTLRDALRRVGARDDSLVTLPATAKTVRSN